MSMLCRTFHTLAMDEQCGQWRVLYHKGDLSLSGLSLKLVLHRQDSLSPPQSTITLSLCPLSILSFLRYEFFFLLFLCSKEINGQDERERIQKQHDAEIKLKQARAEEETHRPLPPCPYITSWKMVVFIFPSQFPTNYKP
jgi:hypothetical protein